VDSNFFLLPVHFAVDPAVDDVTSSSSCVRQMSLSRHVDLIAEYMDIDRVPVGQKTSSPGEPEDRIEIRAVGRNTSSQDEPEDRGETRPGTWAAGAGDCRQTETQMRRTDRQGRAQAWSAAETRKKKMKNTLGQDTVSKRLGILGRVVSKKLKPGGKQKDLVDAELRLRRKSSVGSATQSTRLTSLTDDMLLDHTQVILFVKYLCRLFLASCGHLEQ